MAGTTVPPNTEDDAPCFYLFVHVGTLVRLSSNREGSREIAWEEWASHARLMRKPSDESHWLLGPTSCGKILIPEGDLDELHSPTTHVLYDFPHPSVLRRAVSQGQRDRWRYVVEPEVLNYPARFASTVVSGLPYRKLHTGITHSEGLGRGDPGEPCRLTGDFLYVRRGVPS